MKRLIVASLLLAGCGTAHPPHRVPSEARVTSTTNTTTSTTTTTTTVPPTTTTIAPPAPPTPTNPPVAAPVSSGDDARCAPEIVALIHKWFDRFGIESAAQMTRIAWRESNCRPDVVSSGGCYSVLQMALPLHADLYAAAGYPDWYAVRFDAEANIAAASLLFASSGWAPWRL